VSLTRVHNPSKISVGNYFRKGETNNMPDDITKVLNVIQENVATKVEADPAPVPDKTEEQLKQEQEAANLSNKAFATMRTENATLRAELKALQEQMSAAKQTTPPATPPATYDEAAIERLIAKRVEGLENTVKQQVEQQRLATITNQLTELKTSYGLDEAALLEFAKQAGEANINLRETGRRFIDVYRELNFQKIVEAEVNKGLGGHAPGTGPKGGGTGTEGKSIADVIKEVSSKIR